MSSSYRLPIYKSSGYRPPVYKSSGCWPPIYKSSDCWVPIYKSFGCWTVVPLYINLLTVEPYIYRVYQKSRQIWNRSLFREALQCSNIFIKVDCFGTYNVEWTEKNRSLKLKYSGGCVFYDKLNMAYARNFNA